MKEVLNAQSIFACSLNAYLTLATNNLLYSTSNPSEDISSLIASRIFLNSIVGDCHGKLVS